MKTSRFRIPSTFLMLTFIPLGLTAQVRHEHDLVPLKPWPAPLYWQASHEEAGLTRPVPEASTQLPVNPMVFVGITPCRVVDTRTGRGFTGAFGPPSLAGGTSRTFPIQSSTTCIVPAIAGAYSFNVTIVPPGPLGYVTLYPTGLPAPNASTLNDLQGFIVANAAIVPGGTNGSVDVYASGGTDIIIDINGYYAPQSGIMLSQGSAGAPSLSFSGDSGTGIFSSGAGSVGIASGGNVDLTVASNGSVGIGNTTPSGFKLDVVTGDTTLTAIRGYNNATTGSQTGVRGRSDSPNGTGVNGFNSDISGTGFPIGVAGNVNGTTGAGVAGNAAMAGAAGVNGFNSATSGYAVGVVGGTASNSGAGVQGNANQAGARGVSGFNNATTGYAVGVQGGFSGSNGAGVSGNAGSGGFGVSGFFSSATGSGVGTQGASNNGTGLLGQNMLCTNTGCGLTVGTAGEFHTANGGTLLIGYSGAIGAPAFGNAGRVFSVDGNGNGFFAGSLNVMGSITKGGGSFRIDHPLDPENKYLYHSFVESPDMKNIYDGVTVLDENGEATVTLSDWFEALNQDFRYQLTCIAGYAPVYVAAEVSGNRFRIAGGRPGLKVSWMVTGIRHDSYANTHRIPVEQDKPASERRTGEQPATPTATVASGHMQNP